MYGVWFAGLMNPQPITMTMMTMATFVTTITALTVADSSVPRISSNESNRRMTTAGIFMMPVTPSIVSNGEWRHWYGMLSPTNSRTLLKYSLHAIATVAAPTAYSSTRSHPMIQATNSPIVA